MSLPLNRILSIALLSILSTKLTVKAFIVSTSYRCISLRLHNFQWKDILNHKNHVKLFFSSSSNQDKESNGYIDPNEVVLPLDKLDFAFARSSGPGGQNVNKLNTKAELRFKIDEADWLPDEIKQRLSAYQHNKINNDGELVISSQEHRTQSRNKEDCIDKLKIMISEASMRPKDRVQYEGISEKGKAIRRDEKRKRGDVKRIRKVGKDDFDY